MTTTDRWRYTIRRWSCRETARERERDEEEEEGKRYHCSIPQSIVADSVGASGLAHPWEALCGR